jgi:GT2 family glycosyltransferase
MPQVSAVIVAWNAGDTLVACVESLRDSTRRADAAMQIVVVDNASSDGAVENVRLESGDVVIRNTVNAGYGVAATQGIARSDAPWILLANPDLVVDPMFVEALLAAAERAAPQVATLVPELRYAARPGMVNCRGLTVDEIGVPAEVDAGTLVTQEGASTAQILGGSSGCCLLRSDHVRALGGPEPVFFAYLEDVDLALRLRCAGYGAVFVPDAIAFHEGSASTGARSPLKVYLVARNRRLLFRLHGPWSVRATGWRALTDLAHAAYSTVGTPFAPWAGRVEALRFRRYAAFLRRARKRAEPCRAEFDRPPRASLSATLRRKRTVIADDG